MALVDILKSDFKNDLTKIARLIATTVVPIVGTILYFIMCRGQKLKNE